MLRDRVREALARTEPTPAEARADLEAVLARARKPRRYWAIAASAVVVAALVVFGIRHWSANPPPPTATGGVHIYIHVIGEPEDQALALDLSTPGEKP